MLKFKEITSKGKITKIGGNPEAELFSVNSPLQNKYSIIDSISLSYNLVKHYVSPFFRKEIIKMFLKISLCYRSRKPAKIYCQIFIHYIFIAKLDFEKQNNYLAHKC
jgi:hypothetical protein